mmetsp:Transcript_30383/g.58513  ORF Transcript_30383/g.58513 Transcript_30383/m.58513 type:complete len:196 (-) Transcript_30383:222-809(-)
MLMLTKIHGLVTDRKTVRVVILWCRDAGFQLTTEKLTQNMADSKNETTIRRAIGILKHENYGVDGILFHTSDGDKARRILDTLVGVDGRMQNGRFYTVMDSKPGSCSEHLMANIGRLSEPRLGSRSVDLSSFRKKTCELSMSGCYTSATLYSTSKEFMLGDNADKEISFGSTLITRCCGNNKDDDGKENENGPAE